MRRRLVSPPRVVPADEYRRPREIESESDWFSKARESEGFPYYLEVLRSRLWFIILVLVLCVGAAVFSLSRATRVYESSADVLVTPVASDNSALVGLGLPTASSDPARDIETVARLIKTQVVARRVIQTLHLETTPGELLGRIDTTPVASSNVIAIAARANAADGAAQLANAFAAAAVADRTARMHASLDTMIPELKAQIASLRPSDVSVRADLLQRLRDLETLRAGQDPTVRVEVPAEPHSSPIAPRPMLTIAAAILAGLLIGGAVAVGSQMIDPRLRQEEQLRRYRIPVLARVPVDGKKSSRRMGPLIPAAVPTRVHDSYALLAASLAGANPQRSILVTGPSPGDGKTTSALSLASAVAAHGPVILVEGDSRRPMLGRLLSVRPEHGLGSVLAGMSSLGDSLVRGSTLVPGVQLLLQAQGEPPLPVSRARARQFVEQAFELAEWVIVDTPPLNIIPDVLPLAQEVDDVVIVVRMGNTRLKAMAELAELLSQQGITPSGFVLIGGRSSNEYYK
jgi:Mrp family chromosome partitioning ATPase